MSQTRHLGGTRQSSPLADENSYPLTKDEYLTIRDNLLLDKLTNLESLLISTFISGLISTIVIYFTGSLTKIEINGNAQIEKINISQIIILIIYGAVTGGAIISYLVSWKMKKKSKSTIERLDNKIKNHLEI